MITIKIYEQKRSIEVLTLKEFAEVVNRMDVGDVRHPVFDVSKKLAPQFGRINQKTHEVVNYRLKPYQDLNKLIRDQFIDNELKKIKNTPLEFVEAIEQFSMGLVESRLSPTHVVEVGTNIYTVINLDSMHVKVGTMDGDPAACLINSFDQWPVFRVKS